MSKNGLHIKSLKHARKLKSRSVHVTALKFITLDLFCFEFGIIMFRIRTFS